MIMKRFRHTMGAALIAAAMMGLASCGGSSSDRVTVESITVFGDSLSDVGTYHPATNDPDNWGKFTVNPGNVWTENIAAHYGLEITPNRALTLDRDASLGATTDIGTATVIGGNGYAEGGARVSMFPSESGIGNNQLVSPVREQVDRYLEAHERFGSRELVLVSGGGNDLYAQFSAVCWNTDDNNLGPGNTTLDIATDQISEAANAMVSIVQRMRTAGARLIVVILQSEPTSSPFWLYYGAPEYQAQGCFTPVTSEQRVAWSNQFNEIVREGLGDLIGVVLVDPAKVWDSVLADPAAYGFVNTTEPACNNTQPTNSATFCTQSTVVAPDAAHTYFWSDSFHPTPGGHQILSDHVLELLGDYAK